MNLKSLKNMDRDDLLNMIGLERHDPAAWVVPVVSAFSVGLLVGAGIGLLLAPKAGNELRADLRQRLQGGSDSLANSYGTSTVEKSSPPRTL